MSTDIERELELGTKLRGFRFGLQDFLAHLGGAKAVKELNDRTKATYLKESLIDRKTKELLIIVACVARQDMVSHIQVHMHAAHKGGATPEEILEALNLVSSWIGTIAKFVGLEAWRVAFRPDIPTIDRVVELR